MNVPITILSSLVAIIFTAGVAWTTLKIVKRDVNGLGRKFGQLDREVVVILLTLCKEEDRKWLAEILLRR